MFDRLVVGFDGSQPSVAALRWAAGEAQLRRAKVDAIACVFVPVLFPVWPVGQIPLFIHEVKTMRADAQADLGRVLADVTRSHPDVAFHSNVVDGHPLDVLVLESERCDMVVIGATGARAVEAPFLGSTASGLARTCASPLVLVPGGEQHARSDRIVVGTDGSGHSDAALDWAADEADRRGAELVVVHAWWYPYGGTELAPSEMHDRTRVDASLVLGVAVERCQERAGVSVRGLLLEHSAAPALIEQGLHADMVVVGSRGRGRFRTLLFGSVARAVSEHAPCPIVVVRPPRT